MDGSNLPVEIIERILFFCDGQTLKTAKQVNPVFEKAVDYLFQKYPLWQWCCSAEIPQNELIEYLDKYKDPKDPDKWKNIYDNWISWKDIDACIDFDIVLSPAEIPRITCISVFGRYIAVGSEDGRIRIYNDRWDLLDTERHLAVRVTSITFICDDETKETNDKNIFLLIAYKCRTLVLEQFLERRVEPLIVRDVKSHSVFKKFICYEKTGGRVSVTQLHCEGAARLFEITFVRIYSPSEVTCLNMWRGVCTFLVNSEVKILKYDSKVQPVTNVEKKANIKFTLRNLSSEVNNCQIYRDDIIIGLSKDGNSLKNQFLELFILGNSKEYSKKLFNSWEVLQAYITCTFLYGNTFILGVDSGIVYFYHVSSWKTFDIRNYQHKETISKHPIIGIDVKENKMERKFYITTNVNIHEIVGFSIPQYIANL